MIDKRSYTAGMIDLKDNTWTSVKRLKLMRESLHLLCNESITYDEYNRLFEMINSPDEENLDMAISIIDGITKTLYMELGFMYGT